MGGRASRGTEIIVMPKVNPKVPDELLRSNGVWDLDPTTPISKIQVVMITDLSAGDNALRPPVTS